MAVAKAATALKVASIMVDVLIDLAAANFNWLMNIWFDMLAFDPVAACVRNSFDSDAIESPRDSSQPTPPKRAASNSNSDDIGPIVGMRLTLATSRIGARGFCVVAVKSSNRLVAIVIERPMW